MTALSALGWVLGVVAVVVMLPVLVLVVQCLAGAMRTRASSRAPARAPTDAPTLVVLIPAHDEASGIEETVRALTPELSAGDRVVVVADNCTDDTAARAHAAGAQVVVRTDPARRGKGYALAVGVEALANAPPEVVVVLDADCRFGPGSLAALARAARDGPAQARNTIVPPQEAGPLAALSAFAFLLKNVARASGGARLGWPCPLMGTGMAFPYAVLRGAPLATGALAEDLQLGVALAIAGHPARYCPDAAVTSPMPALRRARDEERRRWEYGHLATVRAHAPRLLRAAVAGRSPRLLAMALDLAVPPLSVLALWVVGTLIATLALGLAGGVWWPALLACGAPMGLAVAVVTAWAAHSRGSLPLSTLLLAPVYVARKVPLYVGLVIRRPLAWVRAEREPPSQRPAQRNQPGGAP